MKSRRWGCEMTVQENITQYELKVQELKKHPMCGQFLDEPDMLRVVYPAGDFGVGYDGLTCRVGDGGKSAAIDKLLKRMEADWAKSFPGATS